MKLVWMNIGVFCACMIVAYGVYFLFPDQHGLLLLEDSLVENLGAVAFLASFVVGLLLFMKSTEYRKSIAVVSCIGLVGFLDEISFGIRFFHFENFRIYGVSIDGAHDLFYLLARLIDTFSLPMIAGLFLVGIVTIALFIFRYGKRVLAGLLNRYEKPTLIIVGLFGVQLIVAMVIDLEIVRNDMLFVFEEQLEMNAAISLVFCSLSLYHEAGKKQCDPGVYEE